MIWFVCSNFQILCFSFYDKHFFEFFYFLLLAHGWVVDWGGERMDTVGGGGGEGGGCMWTLTLTHYLRKQAFA